MNPFWSMSTSSMRKRPETEEKALVGEVKNSPPRTTPKKQLPSIPKNAVPMTKPASPAQSANGTHASYGPFYLEYSLLAEFTLVVKQKLPGVYVQPSYQSALMWFGVIFIRHGLYLDGVFKFTVYIPDNYPDGDCPRLVFDLPIFHPLVDPISGELDVKRAFAKWRRNHNHIWQILMYARRIFYKIDTTSPLNPEAAVLYEKDIQLFKSKVVDSVKFCSSRLFDPPKIEDPYAISFSPWNPAIHDEAREKMLTQKSSGILSGAGRTFLFLKVLSRAASIYKGCSLFTHPFRLVDEHIMTRPSSEVGGSTVQKHAGFWSVLGEAWLSAAFQQRGEDSAHLAPAGNETLHTFCREKECTREPSSKVAVFLFDFGLVESKC